MDLGSLLGAVIVLSIIGVALYLLFTYIPMAEPIKTIIMVLVVLCAVLYLLTLVGIVPKFR